MGDNEFEKIGCDLELSRSLFFEQIYPGFVYVNKPKVLCGYKKV